MHYVQREFCYMACLIWEVKRPNTDIPSWRGSNLCSSSWKELGLKKKNNCAWPKWPQKKFFFNYIYAVDEKYRTEYRNFEWFGSPVKVNVLFLVPWSKFKNYISSRSYTTLSQTCSDDLLLSNKISNSILKESYGRIIRPLMKFISSEFKFF